MYAFIFKCIIERLYSNPPQIPYTYNFTTFLISNAMYFKLFSKVLIVNLLLMVSSLTFAQISYKISLDADKITYRVYMKSNISYSGSQARIGSAQVTIIVPHGATNKFIIGQLKGKIVTNNGITSEMLWSSTRVEAPSENISADYLSFGFNNSASPILFDIAANQEIEILSFKNMGMCLGVVSLFNNTNDPFNSPNSVNSNPGNSISVAGYGFGNAYQGNIGGDINCTAAVPDLKVTSAGSTTITVGSSYLLTLTAINIGTAATSGTYQIQTTLPVGISYLSSIGSAWSCSNISQSNGKTLVNCQSSEVINKASNSVLGLNLIASNPLTNGSAITINGVINGGGDANVTNNNYTWNPTIINNSPNLTASMTGFASITAGVQMSYTINLNNVGTANTSGQYSISLNLPAGINYNSYSGSGWSVGTTSEVNGSTTIHAVSSNIINTNGSAIPFILNIMPSTTLTNGSQIIYNGFVSGGGEGNSLDNSFSFTSTVINTNSYKPDLKISISGAASIVSGVPINYTLNVQNIGNVSTSGVYLLTTTLPAGFTFNSFNGTNWSCKATPQANNSTQVLCQSSVSIGAVTNANPLSLNLTPTGNPQTSLVFNTIITGGGDANTSNNSASFTSIISTVGSPYLNVSIAGQTNIIPTVSTNFIINVNNSGTMTTSGAYFLTTYLPIGVRYNSSVGNGWICTATNQVNGVTKLVCQSSTPIDAGTSASPITINITPVIYNPNNIRVLINSEIIGGGSTNSLFNVFNFFIIILNQNNCKSINCVPVSITRHKL